jgi:serine/threonine-protein kinase
MENQPLTSERWRRVKEIFQTAIELEPVARTAWLADACADDSRLRAEVESLLAAHERPGSFLDAPAFDPADFQVQQNSLSEGQSFGHYRILSLLGKGGMGEVWLAQDTRLLRQVALKLLPPEFTGDLGRVRRFIREAQAASALNHPNIITIHEIGQAADLYYIASEFIEGRTLRQRLAEGQPALVETLDIVIQIATALAAAHEAGIIHRDIKPENVMLRRDGYVKVLDFGLAKLSRLQIAEGETLQQPEPDNLQSTQPGMVMGTASYMAPEQARGQKVDHRTDIFSLGVVLFEMTTGEQPFRGASAADVIAELLNQEPLPQAFAAMPDKLKEIVTRALRKNRAERYQSSADLLTDLKSLRLRAQPATLSETKAARQTGRNNLSQAETLSDRHRLIAPDTNLAPGRLPDFIRRHLRLAVALLSALAVAMAGLNYFNREKSAIESVAVLPFVNAGGSPDTDYLADGLTEGLINSLSQLSDLQVRPRNSVFRFRDRGIDAETAGRELEVEAILTGRIAPRGDEVTISCELTDLREHRQLWGARYERRLSDLQATQAEIAQQVSQSLRRRLLPAERQRLTRRSTPDAEAWLAWLKGHYIWSKRRREDYPQAIAYFQQAIARDPTFAQAWAGLANCYVLGGGGRSGREIYPKAKAAAQEALRIDESLAEAHAALGQALLFYDWNPAAAEAEFRRALALNPDYATAHHWYADSLVVAGRFDEALAQIRLANELDPSAEILIRDTGRILYYAGRYDEAIARCQAALEMNAGFYPAILTLGDIYLLQQRYDKAQASYQQALKLAPGMAQAQASLAHTFAAAGRPEEARRILDELLAGKKPVLAFDLAIIYAGLGETDQAIRHLEQAYEERFYRLIFLGVNPLFNRLRNDPRFADLLRRIGLQKSRER